MVGALGKFRRAMDGHDFSADSRLSAGRHDFGNCAGVRSMDALSEGLLR